jgi:hypothetical protein
MVEELGEGREWRFILDVDMAFAALSALPCWKMTTPCLPTKKTTATANTKNKVA